MLLILILYRDKDISLPRVMHTKRTGNIIYIHIRARQERRNLRDFGVHAMISLALAIVFAEHPRPLLYITSLEQQRRGWKITRDLSPPLSVPPALFRLR